MVVVKISVLLISALCLTACMQYPSNGEKEYLRSRNGVPVVVPKPLSEANISHFYDLPPQTQAAQVSILPPYGS